MSGFLGSYTHQIDEKGRLSLPAPFRRERGEEPLVLVHVNPDSLTLFPRVVWSQMEERLREMLRRNRGARPYVLKVTANATEVVPDAQGRIMVPQRMQKEVGITGPTLIVGAMDRIELWNPEAFEALTTQAVPDEELLAHEIFY
jgi:MraZ protein